MNSGVADESSVRGTDLHYAKVPDEVHFLFHDVKIKFFTWKRVAKFGMGRREAR